MAAALIKRFSPSLVIGLVSLAACARSMSSSGAMTTSPLRPDPRIGLRAGWWDAAEATWNLRVVSRTRPSASFINPSKPDDYEFDNSDLAFLGNHVIQGNYHGFQVWDISDPRRPRLVIGYVCPAFQNDVSAYKHLLFVSIESLNGRLDCGTQGVKDTVSSERIRGIRIFDISDVTNPKNVANVQTCRGSHTHSLLVDPNDTANVYVYVSGSAPVRPANELPGCVRETPDKDPSSALFRIEVIKVPLAHPEQAAIVSSPRIFSDLTAPQRHGPAPEEIAAAKAAKEARRQAVEAERARGGFTATFFGEERVVPPDMTRPMLDSIVQARGRTGAPTAADSAALRNALPDIIGRVFRSTEDESGPRPGPNQCHDITVYPAIGLAGGACEGYGFLVDIRDPAHPVRIAEVADSNFAYWHSATFNNDGTKILFTDEWGGGGSPKCRVTDPKEWGANAIFTLESGRMRFQSYYKLPAPQTREENCVAHNGSLIPIPGRDVMVQGWYQGGISVFEWTDPAHPQEIAFHDRGPVDSTKLVMAGSWSAYWYNGVIVSSEIARGLDIFELTPSAWLSQNEIDAAKTVRLEYFNAQGQPKFAWPPSFALARAYLDQVERSHGLAAVQIAAVRRALARAERASGGKRRDALTELAVQLDGDAGGAHDQDRVRMLARAVRDLVTASPQPKPVRKDEKN